MNKPDYNNSITNLSNSILKHFGAKNFHNTIPQIDEVLQGKKRVLVFLFDGMGKSILEKNLPSNSFLRSHIIRTISSTFPPTTAAATTSFLSAKYPIETGWLGWTIYFKEIDKLVNVFHNKDDVTGEVISGPNIMRQRCPYKNIAERINEARNDEIAKLVFGYPVDTENPEVKKLKSFVKYAYKTAMEKEESFTYAYWTSPDYEMHGEGTTGESVKKCIQKIDRYIRRYSHKNPDVCTLVIADHGLIDVKWMDMGEHPDFLDTLERQFSIEKRCCSFQVKLGKHIEFNRLFKKYYGEYYTLFTKEEVLEQNLFGLAKPSKESLEFLGDYLAVANSEYTIQPPKNEDKKKKFVMKAHHAGNTLDELEISVIAVN